MDDDIIEVMVSGFCKTLNETRSVLCEFEKKDGKLKLEHADCAFGSCQHSKTCLLMKQALEQEE